MPNMSYCRFHNTSLDLQDCVDAMEQAETLADLDLSQYEKDAYEEMRQLCKSFLMEYDRLSDADFDAFLEDYDSPSENNS